MPTICGQCDSEVDRRKTPYISCAGFCSKTYHISCLGIPPDFLLCLKSPGFCWYCTECSKIKNKYEVYLKNAFDIKIASVIANLQTSFEELKSDILKTATEKFSEITDSCKLNVSLDKPTYSQIASSKSVVVIKPKNGVQSTEQTKSDLVKTLNPVDLNLQLSEVKELKDGGLLIGCNSIENANNFTKVAKQRLSNEYQISNVKRTHPKIRIVGFTDELSEDTLMSSLKGQNQLLSSADHTRILKVWATKNNSKIYQVLLEVDAVTYGLVLKQGKLFINYDVCSVFDAIDIKICYKCSGFNHLQNQCNSSDLNCPKCSLNHCLKDCTSNSFKCYNCKSSNQIDDNHAVWDSIKCPIYKKKLDNFKSAVFVTQ